MERHCSSSVFAEEQKALSPVSSVSFTFLCVYSTVSEHAWMALYIQHRNRPISPYIVQLSKKGCIFIGLYLCLVAKLIALRKQIKFKVKLICGVILKVNPFTGQSVYPSFSPSIHQYIIHPSTRPTVLTYKEIHFLIIGLELLDHMPAMTSHLWACIACFVCRCAVLCLFVCLFV